MELHQRLIAQALEAYDFAAPKAAFIRHNENITYCVEDGGTKYLLRVHSPAEGLDFSFYRGGYTEQERIGGEIDLLAGLRSIDRIPLQAPYANRLDQYVTRLPGGELATVLTWLEGRTLSDTPMTPELAYRVGRMTARLHQAARALPRLKRSRYDVRFVDRFIQQMREAHQLGHIQPHICAQSETILLRLRQIIAASKDDLTIVHADLSNSNMIDTQGMIVPIDFSMAGYGIPELDLGDLCYNMLSDQTLRAALLDGYEAAGGSIRREYLGICTAFSFISYAAIHHRKQHDDEKFQRRLERYSATLLGPVLEGMDQPGPTTC